MRKIISAMLVFIIILLGCTSVSNNKQTGLSAEKTVKLFFDYWNKKDSKLMNSIIIKKMQGAEYDLGDLNFVTLKSCVDRGRTKSWDKAWYKNPYDYTEVDVSYVVDYKTGSGGGGLSNGSYNWEYYLVKETKNSDWVIVMWGVC